MKLTEVLYSFPKGSLVVPNPLSIPIDAHAVANLLARSGDWDPPVKVVTIAGGPSLIVGLGTGNNQTFGNIMLPVWKECDSGLLKLHLENKKRNLAAISHGYSNEIEELVTRCDTIAIKVTDTDIGTISDDIVAFIASSDGVRAVQVEAPLSLSNTAAIAVHMAELKLLGRTSVFHVLHRTVVAATEDGEQVPNGISIFVLGKFGDGGYPAVDMPEQQLTSLPFDDLFMRIWEEVSKQ